MLIQSQNIRNFCIIAHIDHGKTTFADYLLSHITGINIKESLDSMDLEKERGITIKSHPVSLFYKHNDGKEYLLNLIDTPGHMDFNYEVSRSIASCECALLLIDASQGIEAQTLSNCNLAISQGLKIIPIISKIDIPNNDNNILSIKKELNEILEEFDIKDVIYVSSKKKIGVDNVCNALIDKCPSPIQQKKYDGTTVLIFDSFFDSYKGVIYYVRVFSGDLKPGDHIIMMNTNSKAIIKEVGIFTPKMQSTSILSIGWVGYIVTNIRSVSEVKIGDTITKITDLTTTALTGYKKIQPLVFCGIYPKNSKDYEKLKLSIEKLHLNDSSFSFENENSYALGQGFRCGFLGLLHMDIIQERMKREYNIEVILTAPNVIYKVLLKNGKEITLSNPDDLPNNNLINEIIEPIAEITLYIPINYIGDILELVAEKRGFCEHTKNVERGRILLICKVPFNEILIDFNDKIKSITHGYASMDYTIKEYSKSHLIKLDILINGIIVREFSNIYHKSKIEKMGKLLCHKIKQFLSKQLFSVVIQASANGKIIARETLGVLKKDVTAKCYGGDITRKRKLIEKQKKGKDKMKKLSNKIDIPHDVFLKILKSN